MSYPSPVEEKKPGFWRRPVPTWVFVLVIIVLIIILFIPSFFIPAPPTIQQPLVLSPDSHTLFINSTETLAVNFTVVDLNATNAISTTAVPRLYYFSNSNSTQVPASGNITLTVYGVYTGSSFAASSGNTVSFQPGGNTLVIDVKAQSAHSGLYTLAVVLAA